MHRNSPATALPAMVLIGGALCTAAAAVLRTNMTQSLSLWPCESANPCYHEPVDIGCFPINSDSPFCKDVFPPESPAAIGAHFVFYSHGDIGSAQQLDLNDLDGSIGRLRFDAAVPLAVVIHGFTGGNKTWMYDAKAALANRRTHVLLVHWEHGSAAPDYFLATANTRVMGALLAAILRRLAAVHKVELGRATLVGFSLGAHVAGFAGKRLRGEHGLPMLGRIVGLDPAGPLFEGEPSVTHLDRSDAQFVHCVHTNGVALYYGGFGTLQPMGHVDIYANGGQYQPGCTYFHGMHWDLHNLTHRLMHAIVCNHVRATWLFGDALRAADEHQAGQCADVATLTSFRCNSSEHFMKGDCMMVAKEKCTSLGYDLADPAQCGGRYYFATTQHNREQSVKYFGSQYLFETSIPDTAWIKKPYGTLDCEFVYDTGGSTTINQTALYNTDTHLTGRLLKPVVAPCRSGAAAALDPTALVLRYNSTWLFAPDTVELKYAMLHTAGGRSLVHDGAFALDDERQSKIALDNP